jgi:hypothetical protein
MNPFLLLHEDNWTHIFSLSILTHADYISLAHAWPRLLLHRDLRRRYAPQNRGAMIQALYRCGRIKQIRYFWVKGRTDRRDQWLGLLEEGTKLAHYISMPFPHVFFHDIHLSTIAPWPRDACPELVEALLTHQPPEVFTWCLKREFFTLGDLSHPRPLKVLLANAREKAAYQISGIPVQYDPTGARIAPVQTYHGSMHEKWILWDSPSKRHVLVTYAIPYRDILLQTPL